MANPTASTDPKLSYADERASKPCCSRKFSSRLLASGVFANQLREALCNIVVYSHSVVLQQLLMVERHHWTT